MRPSECVRRRRTQSYKYQKMYMATHICSSVHKSHNLHPCTQTNLESATTLSNTSIMHTSGCAQRSNTQSYKYHKMCMATHVCSSAHKSHKLRPCTQTNFEGATTLSNTSIKKSGSSNTNACKKTYAVFVTV